MSKDNTKSVQNSVKTLFQTDNIKKRFNDLLGEKSQGFISSVLQIVNNNELLSKADPSTVLNAAATAAILDLPVNPNLGFAWIVPYKGQAQFQMGYKGYVQLAQRTGQYQRINVVCVYENQYKGFNALTEDLEADFSVDGNGSVVGYAAYFRMNNGFEKLVYWTKDMVISHAKKYSQSYGKKFSPWSDVDKFDAMAMKTVLKNALSKWGILSIKMQTAIEADQSVQKEAGKYHYVDNDNKDENGHTIIEIPNADLLKEIRECQTPELLDEIYHHNEAEITRSIKLVQEIGKRRKELENG